jgi:hypothetical protein
MDPNYPPNPNAYPPAAVLPTSTMAIVSVVSGILGFTLFPFVGSIIAIITGGMARKETRAVPPLYSGDGLATAGIIMGWIGVALGVLTLLCIACSFVIPFLAFIPVMLTGG